MKVNEMKKMYDYTKPIVVAEIGCNHKGDMAIAKELIDLAKLCNADYAKFQKRNPRELLTDDQYNAPHPNQMHSFGNTYGKHREFLEFSIQQHKELKDYCGEKGIGYATSVWDISSASGIIDLKPDYIKIPSACNTNEELLKFLRDEYKGDIHISFGMTTRKEEERAIEIFEETGQAKSRLIVYSCTSGYPISFDEVNLLEIVRIKGEYSERVKNIGFSGHHLGIAIDNVAYSLGAAWVERHFTKDRTWKGTDHAASLEPTGLKKLVRDLNASYRALTFKNEEILEIEKEQRIKLKYKKQ